MIKNTLLHPHILKALALAGHGAQIMITDGNYPSSTETDSRAEIVHLNLTPGMVSATDVLKAIVDTINIEDATVKTPTDEPEPEIFNEYRSILGEGVSLKKVGVEFNGLCSENDKLVLVIVTAEQRIYANLLLSIGLVM